MRNFFKALFERCMTEPDFNSRFVFFAHGLVSTLAVLILTIAFIAAKNKEGYDMMVLAAGGSATGAAVGRWMTKKGGADGTPPEPKED